MALAAAIAGLIVIAIAISALAPSAKAPTGASPATASANAPTALNRNPELDPGAHVDKPAPSFTLTDQFGHKVSLSAYRGKVVILAFNDSQCTTVCPLTTTAMVDAKRLLGAAGRKVALLGVDANPRATSVADVRAYSKDHGMLYQWRFLTAPAPQLKRVWAKWGIAVEITRGLIDHTPALFVIDPHGNTRAVYQTQMSYSSVPQLGQELAREASGLLPGHPAVHSSLSYSYVKGIGPATSTSIPLAGGGTLALGPGHARLLLFFDSWDAEVFPDIRAQLEALNRYAATASARGLPPLAAVDEASVEPSASALPRFLRTLPHRLSYPVAIDRSGRIADGYEVQDEPWIALVNSAGKLAWFYDISTQGWLKLDPLIGQVRGALARAETVKVTNGAGVTTALAGSPRPLAALHAQASRLLGSDSELMTRIKQLRGYPVVINAWASWCEPCRTEYPLFASASEQYGKRVAFLGADTLDTASSAQQFLAKHPLSYPSYEGTESQLSQLAVVADLPTTIFISRSGKVTHVKIGQYDTQGSLNSDISSYALGS